MAVEVRTDLPYGNAGEVSILQRGGRTAVHFSPHPHGGPECLWFSFRLVWPDAQGDNLSEEPEPVDLVLEHVGNMLGGHQPQIMRPVIRFGGGTAARPGPGRTASAAEATAVGAAARSD